MQTALYIAGCSFGGCGCKCKHGYIGVVLSQNVDLSILGAEIVSPFGDAMGFIDHKQTGLDRLKKFNESRVLQPFGRKKNELDGSCSDMVQRHVEAVGHVIRCQSFCFQSFCPQCVRLILHKRNQG